MVTQSPRRTWRCNVTAGKSDSASLGIARQLFSEQQTLATLVRRGDEIVFSYSLTHPMHGPHLITVDKMIYR